MNSTLLFIGMPGLPEMLVVLFLALLMFGGAKLPGLMRNLGRSANEFKRGMQDLNEEDDATMPAEEEPAPKKMSKKPVNEQDDARTPAEESKV